MPNSLDLQTEVDTLRAEVRQLKAEKEEALARVGWICYQDGREVYVRPSGCSESTPSHHDPQAEFKRVERQHRRQVAHLEAQVASLIDQLAARTEQRDALIQERAVMVDQCEKTVAFHRDMAARFAEDRDEKKHALRAAEQHGAHLAQEIQRLEDILRASNLSAHLDGQDLPRIPQRDSSQRCEGRYPVPSTRPPRDEPFEVTYRCGLPVGHDGPHRMEP